MSKPSDQGAGAPPPAPSAAAPTDAPAAFEVLGRLVLAENSVASVMSTVSALAKSTIPAAFEVSVTMLDGAHASTVASTGPAALELDERQYERGFGPCMDAARLEQVVEIPDMGTTERYQQFAEKAIGRGVHSSLTMPIPMQQHVAAALNIYALEPHAFDDESRELAATFASYAGVALANMHLYERTSRLAEQLETAMSTRAVIEQAKGILMGTQHVSADAAFTLLVSLSQQRNHKLRDVAQEIVDRAAAGPPHT